MFPNDLFSSRRSRGHRQSWQRKRSNRNGYDLLEPGLPLTTFLVNTLVDDGSGTPDGNISLREAIIAANTNAAFGDAPAGDANGDRIQFEVAPGSTFVLTAGQIQITDDLLVQGGNDGLTIDGNGNDRLFEITSNEGVAFARFRFTGGGADFGGAMLVSGSRAGQVPRKSGFVNAD